MPFFSIGVPTYDRVDMLKETLSSVLGQTFSDFEVIVSNDNPNLTINEDKLRIKDPRVRFINQSRNLNPVNNFNYLLKANNSKYFTWLGDDDLYQPNFLQVIYRAIIKHDFPPCVFTSYTMGPSYPGQDGISTGEGQVFSGRQFLKGYLTQSIRVQGCYGVFDTQYIRQTGGFEQLGSSPFSFYADGLLAIRCGLLEKIVFISAPLIFYRAHAQSVSLVSPDVDGYSTAQRDLLDKSARLFEDKRLICDFNYNLFYLLRWCLRDYFIVIGRSGKFHWRKLMKYLIFLCKYTKRLGVYYSTRMITAAVFELYRLTFYQTLASLKKKVLLKNT
ncbi:MAG: glycosyltransferase family 2 protein [Candidatus Omnitrophica bacterium]|nr:glycosyltransferase family 2 protein [Candidatus Omnitrophota bacterium]